MIDIMVIKNSLKKPPFHVKPRGFFLIVNNRLLNAKDKLLPVNYESSADKF